MYFDVASVVANNDFTLSLVFEDGKSGIYDMKPLIGKGPWEHLASLSFFKTVSIDCGTAVWPGISISLRRSCTRIASPRRVSVT